MDRIYFKYQKEKKRKQKKNKNKIEYRLKFESNGMWSNMYETQSSTRGMHRRQ